MKDSMTQLGEAIQHVMVAAAEHPEDSEEITLLVHNRCVGARLLQQPGRVGGETNIDRMKGALDSARKEGTLVM